MTPGRRREAAVLILLALGLTLAVSLHLAAGEGHFLLSLVHHLAGWMWVPGALLCAAAAARRLWRVAAWFALLTTLCGAWVLPGTVRTETSGEGPHLRVVTANVLTVNGERDLLLDELLTTEAHVVVLQEYSSRWQATMEDPRALQAWPHRLERVREDSFGIAIVSALPLTDTEIFEVVRTPWARATVELAGREIQLLAVHPLPPFSPAYHEVWGVQLDHLDGRLDALEGPAVVAGDLNLTRYGKHFARLTDGRFRGAHRACGRDAARTWNNFQFRFLRLDHVLISDDLGCASISEGVGAGSDHAPVVADLVLRQPG